MSEQDVNFLKLWCTFTRAQDIVDILCGESGGGGSAKIALRFSEDACGHPRAVNGGGATLHKLKKDDGFAIHRLWN